MLDIHILRHDPSHFSEFGCVRFKIDRHSGEVAFLGRAEEWRRLWVLGTKIISEWCEHRDESIASVCQRKNAELVEEVRSVGDGGKQPVEVVLINTLREEGDNFEERPCVGAKLLEHQGGERKFDSSGEALVMLGLQHACSSSLPFPGQSVGAPLILTRNSSEQGDRKWMEVKLFQNVVDWVGLFVTFVDLVEGATGGIHRQRGDIQMFAIWGSNGDTGCDTNANVAEPT